MPRPIISAPAIVLAFALAAVSCKQRSGSALKSEPSKPATALEVVLTPLDGTAKEDREIAALQQKLKDQPEATQLLERLGWAFVAKARLTSDPGFYKLAEQCSVAMESAAPNNADAALLRGHIAHALHRFKEAEAIARDLTSRREFVFDYALLGDALMEQGQLGPAVEAYQKMVDLKPCLQTYSRVAHIRWLKGDLAGAIELARVAVRSGSPREPEPLAWACTRLAAYLLQQGDLAGARAAMEEAMQIVPDYSAALLMRGKLLLASGEAKDAAAVLEQAATQCPLPDYLWTEAEAMRAAGDPEQAQTVEAQLRKTGAANDPRTYSLYLATAGTDLPNALRLAEAELGTRQDVFTHDAIAWTLFRSGDIAGAKTQRDLAVSEGTQDARLLFHAGMIANAAGDAEQASKWLTKAEQSKAALLPSERAELSRGLAAIAPTANQISLNQTTASQVAASP